MKNHLNNIVHSLKEELTCALCQDIFDKPQALIPCLHTFCLDCVNSIPREYNTTIPCPICRNSSDIQVNNYPIQNMIDIFKKAEIYSLDRSTNSTPTDIIESLNIDSLSGESSSSSVQIIGHYNNIKIPCRSCQPSNGTNFTCPVPITESQQSGFGHIFCGFCSEYLPARGIGGNEPSITQCCSFCGIVACDKYWGCKNRGMDAKLYVLSEITSIKQYLVDINRIDSLEDGHLNLYEIELLEQHLEERGISWSEAWHACLSFFDNNHYATSITRRMTTIAQQLYNTRRLVYSMPEEEDEEYDEYYDRIGEEGILPSNHLLACHSCAVTIVNGQFYGYWKQELDNNEARGIFDIDYRDKCPQGCHCEAQWRTENHARRLSHIETNAPSSNRTSNEYFEIM